MFVCVCLCAESAHNFEIIQLFQLLLFCVLFSVSILVFLYTLNGENLWFVLKVETKSVCFFITTYKQVHTYIHTYCIYDVRVILCVRDCGKQLENVFSKKNWQINESSSGNKKSEISRKGELPHS